jgi:DNA adenine methylase
MKVKALAPWFGSNRILAENVGEFMAGCTWVGIPFAGGMCEVAHITARTVLVNDVHRHVINLARVVADDQLRPKLVRWLRAACFHPDELDQCQERCKAREPEPHAAPDFDSACAYFVSVWMGRSHIAGTDDEFCGRLSTRWNANGGDSAVRYRNAVKSLAAWGRVMRRCSFSVLDVFAFLERCEDAANHGIYCDPPFPGPGDRYRHQFTEADQRKLAVALAGFGQTRVVCRFYDHPLIRELYPEGRWYWHRFKGRKQSNEEAPEVLIVNVGGHAPTLFAR